MYPAQRINPSSALLWLPLDSSFVAAGITWTRNVSRRGPDAATVTFDGVSAAVTLDAAFTLVVTTSADLRYAGTIASNLSGGVGVQLYTTGSGLIIGSVSDGTATISVTGTLPLTRSPRQISLSSDGSGNALGLVLMVDGVPIPSVPAGGPLLGSISSGADLAFGQGLGTNVMYRIAVYPYVLGVPELRLLRSRPLQRTAQSIVNVWSLADALGANGVFLQADTGLGLVADPALAGDWAGAEWAGSGLGPYTHTAGVGHTDPLTRNILTVGLRYETVFTVSGRTAGSVTWMCGATAGTARSTNATFTEDLTCTTTTAHAFVPSADFDGVVTVVRVTTLSVTSWTPKAATGHWVGQTFTRLVPTQMPFAKSGSIRGDGTTRTLVSPAALATSMHNGAGGTVVHLVRTAAPGALYSSNTVSAAVAGYYLSQSSATASRVLISNASGAFQVDRTNNGVITAGTWMVVSLRSSAAVVQARYNGSAGASDAIAAPSANASGSVLLWASVDDIFHDSFFMTDSYLSDADLLRVERAMGARRGVVI